MPRKKADPSLKKAMCERLVRLLRIAYDDNWAQFAKRLGYANNSGVQAIKDGRAFPDPQRLAILIEWKTDEVYVPSLNWIISGRGPALLRADDNNISDGISLPDLASRRSMKRAI